MAILVAFDTVFEQCSLAVVAGDDNTPACDITTLYRKTVAGKRGQTEIILPMLDEALRHCQLGFGDVNAWAFNRGPGAFSGIRINTAVVQAVSFAHDTPCVGVSSLHALADTAHHQHSFTDGTTITSVMDARQNQVYVGKFLVQQGQIVPIIDPSNPYANESLADYDSLLDCDVLVGDGVDLLVSCAKKIHIHPTADDLARLAWGQFVQGLTVSAQHALPVYLRDNAWKTLAEQGKA